MGYLKEGILSCESVGLGMSAVARGSSQTERDTMRALEVFSGK